VSDEKHKDPFEPLKKDIEARVRKAARDEVIKWTIILFIARRVLGG
jgi:hypothetical protein